MEHVLRDFRYATRSLRRTPAFTLAALATLALGIGATAAVFGVVNAALLAPPPYPDPQRLFVMGSNGQIFNYLRDRSRSFTRIARRSRGPTSAPRRRSGSSCSSWARTTIRRAKS